MVVQTQEVPRSAQALPPTEWGSHPPGLFPIGKAVY
jgi:hypothetical protein